MKSTKTSLILKSGLSFFLLIFCLQVNAQAIKKLNMGQTEPQPEATLPKSKVPILMPSRKAKEDIPTVLEETAFNVYRITKGWEMIEGYKTTGQPIFNADFNSSKWYNATVPGTVLTTLVEQGVYPDPYFGVNNLVIPDTLSRMDWWYRVAFNSPKSDQNKKSFIILNGINYKAEVWLNQKLLGVIAGAFKQKEFDVSNVIKSNQKNILAIKIIPPPNPGYPHEQSQIEGAGRNGGSLDLDGPTFISSLGWDWMPGIRDRNIGIWQDVFLRVGGPVTIDYPQIITDLHLPDTTKASITVKTTLTNHSDKPIDVNFKGKVEDILFEKAVALKAGERKEIVFNPNQYNQLNLKNPRLWWPNGYGLPNLYNMELSAFVKNEESDKQLIRFGIRELTYEMTVDAPQKPAWRVEYNPIKAADFEESIFDNMQRRVAYPYPPSSVPEKERVWIPKLRKNMGLSAFEELKDTVMSPFLVFKVNGKRIYCKGGNWGMDDAMKRSSRERLEPAFRLHRDANFTMIRNWTGESTEEVFYDLADEYGLLVWNDFWLSKDFQDLDVFDTQLFLDNARNVVKRYRNHPSIAIWCARNEGFPLKTLSEGCAEIIQQEDGTRHYTPSSRHLNLSKSGPWIYHANPKRYARDVYGFSTEIGIPSVPTAESMRTMMAEEDLWPISDVWAYHDFHEVGAWNRKVYKRTIKNLLGEPVDLEDFCKKAQIINLESHQAMFEAWNSKLWNNASGVMLWMSHPAWPSTNWQIYSWDYETLGSFYGTKKACEPIHIQLNQIDRKVEIINTTLNLYKNSKIKVKIFDINAKLLSKKEARYDINENELTMTDLKLQYPKINCFLVSMELFDKKGILLSENKYWLSGKENKRDFSAMNQLENIKLTGKVIKKGNSYFVKIINPSQIVAVSVKLNLRDVTTNKRVLPAYFSEGYFTLLPGESKLVSFDYHEKTVKKKLKITAEGYNIKSQLIATLF